MDKREAQGEREQCRLNGGLWLQNIRPPTLPCAGSWRSEGQGSHLRTVECTGSEGDLWSSWSWAVVSDPCSFCLMGVIKRQQRADHLMSLSPNS